VTVYLSRDGGSEAYELAHEAARAILTRGKPVIERRTLIQTVRAFRKATSELQGDALRLLIDFGWLRQAENGYKKAMHARYDVNPLLAQKFAAIAAGEKERRATVREVIAETVKERRAGKC
jgi:hypothetical protein